MQIQGVLSGASIYEQVKASGVEFVISVPDITTAAGLLTRFEKSDTPRLVRVCKEDEASASAPASRTPGSARCC
jgi:sulfopyruvate decarboxylase TPP-binding subunit